MIRKVIEIEKVNNSKGLKDLLVKKPVNKSTMYEFTQCIIDSLYLKEIYKMETTGNFRFLFDSDFEVEVIAHNNICPRFIVKVKNPATNKYCELTIINWCCHITSRRCQKGKSGDKIMREEMIRCCNDNGIPFEYVTNLKKVLNKYIKNKYSCSENSLPLDLYIRNEGKKLGWDEYKNDTQEMYDINIMKRQNSRKLKTDKKKISNNDHPVASFKIDLKTEKILEKYIPEGYKCNVK